MTNFEKAYQELFGMEGVYSVDKEDKGGETFCGIARNYHKSWAGWRIVDANKVNGVLSQSTAKKLLQNEDLMSLVRAFYKSNDWDRFDCDNMPYSLALEVFEESVNLGPGRTAKFLQRVLNAMNYKNKQVYGFGKDLDTDGIWGAQSKARMKEMIKAGYAKQIQFAINCLQGAYYVDRANTATDQRVFFKGWIGQRTEAIYKP